MDNQAAPYRQRIYYPTTSADQTYGYVYIGSEGPSGWYQYPNFVGSDGLSLQLPGMRNENFPCVYYTPGYDYVRPSYNPYIPGAVIGPGTQFMDIQNMQTVPQLGYIPVMYQSQSDAVTTSHPDTLNFNNSVEYSPAPVPMNESAMPLEVEEVGAYDETSSTNLLQDRYMTGGGSQMQQMPIYSPEGENLTETSPIANNGFSNDGTQPAFDYNQHQNKTQSEQSMGPRTNEPENLLNMPLFTANGTNSNSDGCIEVNPDEYNKADFPVDYYNAKFFVIKSYTEDDVHKSIKYNVWSSTDKGNRKLDKAYEGAQRISRRTQRRCPLFLFFSVNTSHHFSGVAEMIGPVDFRKDMDFWFKDKWRGCFPVKWHIIKNVTNSSFRHIILLNNKRRPVASSRDTQEVPFLPGINMLTIFKSSPLKTCIFDDWSHYETRQREIYEKRRRIKLSHDTLTDDSRIKENLEEISNQRNAVVDSNNAAEGSENSTDVLTVGSVQINITEANRLISGPLTIGSFPKDRKGSKR